MLKNSKIVYFKEYKTALETAKLIPESICSNPYQLATEDKCAKIREFSRGYAVQMGDCGDYVTNETLKGLNQC